MLVIGSLVVFVWRGLNAFYFRSNKIIFLLRLGLWVLLDLKLFPEDLKTSAWASLVRKLFKKIILVDLNQGRP